MVPLSLLLDLQRQLRAITLERDMYRRLSDERGQDLLKALDSLREEADDARMTRLAESAFEEFLDDASVASKEAPTADDRYAI